MKITPRTRKLAVLLAGAVLTLGAPLAHATTTTASPGWYCFGQKATLTKPLYGSGTAADPFVFYGTAGKRDVIVGTDAVDDIYGLQPGDVACARGGNDSVQADHVIVDPRTGWNRVKVDLGAGDDSFEVGNEWVDTPQTGTVEVHAGPGNDTISGGEGNDLIFVDSNDPNTYTPVGHRNFDLINCQGGIDRILYSSTSSWGATNCETKGRTSPYQSHAVFVPAP